MLLEVVGEFLGASILFGEAYWFPRFTGISSQESIQTEIVVNRVICYSKEN